MNNNRGNNNRRRSRGNNRPQGGGSNGGSGQQLNRIDSRARGNAPQLLEKYRKLAQDAHLNGDRVQAEYYLQFADHYFRVMADTRLRQEEQRARQNGGVSGDRWQDAESEDDSGEFSMENDFPAFDRPQSRREEQRRDGGRREDSRRDDNLRDDSRRDEGQREDGRRDEHRREDGRRDRSDSRRDDGRRDERRRDETRSDEPRRDRAGAPEAGLDESARSLAPTAETPLPGEGVRAAEGEPIGDVSDNPFVRDTRPSRGLKPRTERKRKSDQDTGPAPALDPASLPPAFGARKAEVEDTSAEAPVAVTEASPAADSAAAEEAPAPKRRGRPRKSTAAEAAPAEG
ncbi:DUF4167 domain-containing protein [Novosphingobium huizhouense]|uniref:DUF4167 domain-containing protein n=1 Tax=Novosphingobium huizhouense TaxID=2866625 RepID=UPI0021E57D04